MSLRSLPAWPTIVGHAHACRLLTLLRPDTSHLAAWALGPGAAPHAEASPFPAQLSCDLLGFPGPAQL